MPVDTWHDSPLGSYRKRPQYAIDALYATSAAFWWAFIRNSKSFLPAGRAAGIKPDEAELAGREMLAVFKEASRVPRGDAAAHTLIWLSTSDGRPWKAGSDQRFLVEIVTVAKTRLTKNTNLDMLRPNKIVAPRQITRPEADRLRQAAAERGWPVL